MSLPNSQITQAVDSILFKLRCYRDPQRVRMDAMEVMKNFPSLQPRAGYLARPNVPPMQTQIMYFAGTVPIFYNSVQYNIPVNVWIIENYPFSPPVCYVTPTPDMVIKPKHRHVDSQGVCYLPYLSSWNPTSSNLTGLCSTMSSVFGQDPPVRSSPKPTSQPQQPQQQQPPQQQQQQQQQQVPYPYGNQQNPNQQQQNPPYPNQQGNNSPYPPQNNSSYPPQNTYNAQQPPSNQPFSQQQNFNPSQPFEDPATVAKRNAVRSATDRVQSKLQEFFSRTTKEIDDLIAETQRCEEKNRAFDLEKQDLLNSHGQYSANLETVTKGLEDINKWLEDNDNPNLEIDVVTEPKDPYSKQLLYLVAEDATIEDCLYYLEKNLMNGELNVEIFLKNVRSLSTEQFLKRATIKKIHERQRSQLGK